MADWLRPQETYPHGSRPRYLAGCRCLSCRSAQGRYRAARAKQGWNGLVSADAARVRLIDLRDLGVGLHRVADVTGLAFRTVQRIRSGASTQIRRRVEHAILSLQPSLAHGQHVNGYQTRKLLRHLEGEGYTKAELARRLGLLCGRLQFHPHVTVRNALKVRQLFNEITAE